jgi:phosphomannomutase
MPLSDDLRRRVFSWVADDPERATAEEALEFVARDEEAALSDRFDAKLEFGTAGLRGLLGAGPNRMNLAVVRRTTAGLCAYLLKQSPDASSRGLVVARDARRGSDAFADEAARVANGMGFVVHFFEEPVPTPVCAFAVEDLGAAAGVMVTASHNPPEYNGYKVYWGNAAQIIPPHDKGIAAEIDAVVSAKSLPLLDRETGRLSGLWRPVAPGVEQRYFAAVKSLDLGLSKAADLSIAYTPLHGVGGRFLKRALTEAGFSHVHVVASQAEPDGAFPTVRFPNPEEPGAMDAVLALALETGADLVLANDPDADRLAASYRTPDGRYVTLSGNDIGLLLGHHRLVDAPVRPGNPLVITTIVSSPMLGVVARELGAAYEETLTGFKWIANKALELESAGKATFVFGYEEALGSTVGRVVRDKDGVGSGVVLANLAAQLKAHGRTLGDRLDDIARQFGVAVSEQHNATYQGAAGAARIHGIMARLRKTTPERIGPAAVIAVRDFQSGVRRLPGGASEPLVFPSSNVLSFDLEGGDRVVARPSGTEPKIKFYFDVRCVPSGGESLDGARGRGRARLAELKAAFLNLAGE